MKAKKRIYNWMISLHMIMSRIYTKSDSWLILQFFPLLLIFSFSMMHRFVNFQICYLKSVPEQRGHKFMENTHIKDVRLCKA